MTAVKVESIDDKVAEWRRQIELAEERSSKWEERGEKIVKRYRDEREESATSASPKKMNLLWSNVQTLMPSLYGREPTPIAERRFLDRDVTGRVASQMLERGLRYEMMDCGFHDAVSQCVLDYCLPGRGTAWLRFVPVEGQASSIEPHGDDQLTGTDGEPIDDGESVEDEDRNLSDDETHPESNDRKLLGASLEVDYVNWKDFLHSKSRTWKEVEWVARRIYMGRKDLVDRFGAEKGNEVSLESGQEGGDRRRTSASTGDSMKKAIVYEIWFKPTRTVYFIAKGFNEMLDEVSDPLNLEGFWPCPRPLFATLTNDTIIPVPDYAEYQDQAHEVDTLTARIDALLKAIKVSGVYDASVKGLARLLDEGHENKLIPVSSWAAFAEKGGLASSISFLPIKEIADVISVLNEARDKAKQDLYEITGLADVIRGQSDPRETAEAVKTKGRFGSLRLQSKQKEVARFCRDIICMMGEIISEHYPDQTLINVSGIMYDEGVGPEMPVPPKKPQLPPPPPPAMAGPGAPAGAAPPQPAGAPPQGMQPHPPMPGAAPGAPPQGAPPAPPNPMAVYQQQMVQYQTDLQQAQMERQQLIQSAIALLRQDKLRGFRIDIETDSTIADDAADEKGARTEFIGAASGFLKQSMEAGQQYPTMVPLLGKMMLFAIRGFHAGRDLESSFEEFIDQAEKDAKAKLANPAPPPPNPEMIKAEADKARAQAEIQAQQIEAQSEAANSHMRMQESQLDFQGKQAQAQAEDRRMAMQAQFDRAAHQQRMQELGLKQQMMMADHEYKMQALAASAAVRPTPTGAPA